ncbi:hypothetical protein FA13DRAFT_340481 [Coprinellus micaceus]|uniref:Uncharacterized protein n=1 Tax=Coprinellus micaceus TaxID=71717 RepID=A0A4Y7TC03_COPMI|nr:hypothetical protein FA13DRAFT_340481 [Coprinellus micaceus]
MGAPYVKGTITLVFLLSPIYSPWYSDSLLVFLPLAVSCSGGSLAHSSIFARTGIESPLELQRPLANEGFSHFLGQERRGKRSLLARLPVPR